MYRMYFMHVANEYVVFMRANKSKICKIRFEKKKRRTHNLYCPFQQFYNFYWRRVFAGQVARVYGSSAAQHLLAHVSYDKPLTLNHLTLQIA